MAKKIIRLTESDLTRLIKRVIMEQEIDYNAITTELKNMLVGKASQFFPSSGQPTQFQITSVDAPQDILKPRILTIKGTTGVATTDRFIPSPQPTEESVEYRCATSNDKEKTKPITRKAKMYVMASKRGLNGGDGTLMQGLVNKIEQKWCSKLPAPPSDDFFL